MVEIFTGFILFLFVDGTPLEFTPKDGLSDCLKTKREIVSTKNLYKLIFINKKYRIDDKFYLKATKDQ